MPVLGHPLLLLLVGAIVSSYLIPALTRSWQNHEKELDLKASLAAEMSEKATDFVMAVQFYKLNTQGLDLGAASQAVRRDAAKQLDDLNRRYRRWEIDSAVIASRLRAYFADPEISADWRALAATITSFYAIEGETDVGRSAPQIEAVLREVRQIPVGDFGDDVRREVTRLRRVGLSGYGLRWGELRAELLARRDALIQRVLDGDTSAF
jgi:hypothetical protein